MKKSIRIILTIITICLFISLTTTNIEALELKEKYNIDKTIIDSNKENINNYGSYNTRDGGLILKNLIIEATADDYTIADKLPFKYEYIKYNSLGEEEWKVNYEGSESVLLLTFSLIGNFINETENEYIFYISMYKKILIYNKNGTFKEEKTINDSEIIYGTGLFNIKDGFITIDESDDKVEIIKYDLYMNILWKKSIENPNYEYNINNIIETKDGEYLAVGLKKEDAFTEYGIVIKLNNVGEIEWERTNENINSYYGAIENIDGDYVVVEGDNLIWTSNKEEPSNIDLNIVTYNNKGDYKEKKINIDIGKNYGFNKTINIVQAPNNNYYISIAIYNKELPDVISPKRINVLNIIEIDKNLELLDKKIINFEEDEEINNPELSAYYLKLDTNKKLISYELTATSSENLPPLNKDSNTNIDNPSTLDNSNNLYIIGITLIIILAITISIINNNNKKIKEIEKN